LAAALSAGETPSPEMVAAAGEREGLRPAWAAGLFAAVLAAVVAIVWVTERSTLLTVVRLDLSPEAMAQKARDVLAGLGYTAKPGSAAWDYHYDYGAMDRVPRNSGREGAARAAAERPPLVYFMYRTSPGFLEPQHFSNPIVNENDPPQTSAGMINLRLDPQGRLASLTAKPPDKQEPATTFDWNRLFQAAGLDAAQFSGAEPEMVPPFAFDARQAWLEAGAKEPLRIEAAAWRGKPVFFRTRKAAPSSRGGGGSDIAGTIVFAGLLAGICGLAWRNARLGRGDRRGASRAAFAVFLVMFGAFLLQLPHAFDGAELGRWLDAAGYALLLAAIFALIYLGLEPHVRRRWPHALITWTRLLGGQWRDPLVATHILIGLAAGLVRILLLQGYWMASGDYTGAPTLVFANGSLRMAGQLLRAAVDALIGVGLAFFLLFFAYRLLRNRWLAVLAATAVFTAQGILSSSNKLEAAIINLLLVGATCAVMMRYGLLAAVAMQLPMQLNFPVTFDSSLWFWGVSCAAVLFVAALGFVAFRFSLAGRPLFKTD
jgi:serine/threonine-protein kinase